MRSEAKTVAEYLASLPPDRRAAIEAVRAVVNRHADPLLEEGMHYGMITWYVPHSVFPPGYHVTPSIPLPYAALASQKQHMSLYLMTAYVEGSAGEAWIRRVWPKTIRPLDMGKSCIRFRRLDDLALDVVGEAVRRVSVADHLAWYATVDPRQPHVHRAPRKTASKTAGQSTGTPARKAAAKAAPKAKRAPVRPAAKRTAAKRTAAKRSAAKKK